MCQKKGLESNDGQSFLEVLQAFKTRDSIKVFEYLAGNVIQTFETLFSRKEFQGIS